MFRCGYWLVNPSVCQQQLAPSLHPPLFRRPHRLTSASLITPNPNITHNNSILTPNNPHRRQLREAVVITTNREYPAALYSSTTSPSTFCPLQLESSQSSSPRLPALLLRTRCLLPLLSSRSIVKKRMKQGRPRRPSRFDESTGCPGSCFPATSGALYPSFFPAHIVFVFRRRPSVSPPDRQPPSTCVVLGTFFALLLLGHLGHVPCRARYLSRA